MIEKVATNSIISCKQNYLVRADFQPKQNMTDSCLCSLTLQANSMIEGDTEQLLVHFGWLFALFIFILRQSTATGRDRDNACVCVRVCVCVCVRERENWRYLFPKKISMFGKN